MRLFPRVSVPVQDDELTEQQRHTRGQQIGMAIALERAGRNVYPGTVSATDKVARRAKGKRQRLARKAHR